MRFFILLFFISFASFSQNENTVYNSTRVLSLQEYDVSKKAVGKKSIILQKSWRFVIDHSDTNGHIIKFLKWEKKDDPNNETIYATITSVPTIQNGNTVQVDKEVINYYYITNSDFKNYVDEFKEENPKYSFVTGAITIPIKIRPSGDRVDSDGNKLRPFDFTGDINIGLSVGVRIRLDKKGKGFIIPSAGINITSVSIDENSVRNNIINSKTNASSLTPFIGLIGEYEDFQIALITGWDKLSGKTGENWIYQGKPWFGIGLGYRIFSTTKNNPTNN